MLPVFAGGNRFPVIAQLVRADEDTVRDVIRHSTRSAWPAWTLDAGGRREAVLPRLLSRDDVDFVVQAATTRPTKLGQPFIRWSIRELAAYLRRVHGHVIRVGRDALRVPAPALGSVNSPGRRVFPTARVRGTALRSPAEADGRRRGVGPVRQLSGTTDGPFVGSARQ